MLDNRIHTFICVCKHMNYTAAAKELNLTQPAVSQHIRYLEDHYKVKLFNYEKKQLELTEAGQLLKQVSATLKGDETLLMTKLRETNAQPRKYRIGATMTVGDYAIIRPLGQFIKDHPAGDLALTISNTDDLLGRLKNSQIDMAIIEGYFPKDQYDYITFSTEKYIPVCAKGHRFQSPDGQSQGLTLKDLTGQRLLLREKGSGTRDIMEKNLQAHGIEIQDFAHRIEVNSLPAIVELVKDECGITFLYQPACRAEMERGTIREIQLKDFAVEHDFTFLWNKGSAFEEEYRSICQELIDNWKKLA